MRWEGHVIKGYILKAVISIDPHQLQVLRAHLGINIWLKPAFLVQNEAFIGEFPFPADNSLNIALSYYLKPDITFDYFSCPARLERSDQTLLIT